jgi:hypothetical protein
LREASLREAGLACFGVYVYPVAMAAFCAASESSSPLRRITLVCGITLVYRPAPRPGIRDVPRLHPELIGRAIG